MPVITMRMDNLNERNTEFQHAPLKQPVFLNSVPKCGTHLLRNTMRMFVGVPQQYHATFVQVAHMRQHGPIAFSTKEPKLSWGHLLFYDDAAALLKPVRHILLVRDPYSWVIARARFFLSDNFEGKTDNLKSGDFTVNDILNMMIFGIYGKAPAMDEIFRFNGAAWLGSGIYLVRYEELVHAVKTLDTLEAEVYFRKLLDACGIDVPDDWRERVRIGSDRKQSSTARENLAGEQIELPDELPDIQKRLVDYACPGLRQLLGYS